MKKTLVVVLLLLAFLPSVQALKGMGIVYGTVITEAEEGENACFKYGVYNPWDEDIRVELTTSGELKDLNPVSEHINISAGTGHKQAKNIEICFEIPNVYNFNCPEKLESFKGKIIATEFYPAGVEGTGSSTAVSAAAPLEIKVKCNAEDQRFSFDTNLFIIGLAIIGISLAGFLIHKFFKTHKVIRKK